MGNQLKLLHQIAENEQTLYLLCINFRHLHLVIYLFVPRPTCANEKSGGCQLQKRFSSDIQRV